MSSCNANKFLQDEERFIKKNQIEFKSDLDKKTKNKLEYKLLKFTPKTNSSFLFFFDRAGVYYANKDKNAWYNRYLRENVGEKPSLFSEKVAQISVKNMQNYLRNKKGYYEAEVDYSVEENKTTADITYLVDPKSRYVVNDFSFIGKDTATIKYIESLAVENAIVKGTPIDEGYFNDYKANIANILQNDGYADFSAKNLRIYGDSSYVNKDVDIFMEVIPPDGDSLHHVYHVSDVRIHTALNHTNPDNIYQSETVNGIFYKYTTAKHLVKPEELERYIYINSGDKFSKDARNKTLKKLSSLGPYRFVSFNLSKDTLSDNGIIYDIFLNPFAKKWDFEMGFDTYYARLNQPQQKDIQLVGINLGTEFRNRNLFRGAEKYILSTETGFEFQFQKPYLRTFIVGLQNSLEFPRLLNSFGFKTALRSTRILSKTQFKHLEDNTVTRIGLGGNLVDINNFYSIGTIKGNYSYVYKYNELSKFAYRQVGLDLNIYDVKEGFQPQVDRNPLLARSFVDNVLTGYVFRDISFFYNDSSLDHNHSNSLYVNFETSGLETFGVNKLYNLITRSDGEWKLSNRLSFAKYFRLESSYRHYRHLSKKVDLATRVYLGSAIPYGDNKFIPFGKQFYVGGPNSMRGWNQRELGPGGYDPRGSETTRVFYQQGDIKFESNAELRFDIFKFFEGALFVDAGNVWTLQNDEQREGSQFSKNFYDQIAVSSGVGLRLDFDFFNIRFDFGYKIRYPYEYEPGRKWATWENIKSQGIGNLQVAVNYPF